MTTAFSRLYTIRNAIKGQAFIDRDALKATVAGLEIIISDQTSAPFHFSIPQWSRAAAQAILEFKKAVEELIPHGLKMDFPMSKFSDKFTPQSPHKLADTQSWLYPIQKSLYRSFFTTEGNVFTSEKGQSWLNSDQTVLEKLAAVVYMTTGICPSVTQTRVRFDSEGVYGRDIFLLADGSLIFNNHVSTLKRDGEVSPNLFAFPQDITCHMLYYLYVLRPLGIEILEAMGRNAPHYNSEVWAHTTRQKRVQNKWRWTTMDFDKQVSDFTLKTFGTKIPPGSIRRITKSLFSSEFPELFVGPNHSSVDDAGQHKIKVSWGHYGRSLVFPSFPNIVADQAIRFLAVSQIWQALFQIGPISETWRDLASKSELFQYGNLKLRLASTSAKNAIHQHYGIPPGPFDKATRQKAQDILNVQPFLFGNGVCNFSTTFSFLLKFLLGKQEILW